MKSLQDVGKQILMGNPDRFYIFCGTDYGIKCKYLQHIIDAYSGEFQICPTVKSVVNLMSHKHMIPLVPKVYIVKYDDEFLSELSDKSASVYSKLNIIGTLVIFFEGEKACKKCDKYLPENSVDFVNTNPKFVYKYLVDEYAPLVPDDAIRDIVEFCTDYNSAHIVCEIVSRLPNPQNASIDDISKFCYNEMSSDAKYLRNFIVNRDFIGCLKILDDLDAADSAYFTIFSTMLELEKSPSSSWGIEDIYNMFNQTYRQLELSRKYNIDIYNSLVYLFALLRFERIPSVEVM